MVPEEGVDQEEGISDGNTLLRLKQLKRKVSRTTHCIHNNRRTPEYRGAMIVMRRVAFCALRHLHEKQHLRPCFTVVLCEECGCA